MTNDESLIKFLIYLGAEMDASGRQHVAASLAGVAARLSELTVAAGFRIGDRVVKSGARSRYSGEVRGVILRRDGLASLGVQVDDGPACAGLLLIATPETLTKETP